MKPQKLIKLLLLVFTSSLAVPARCAPAINLFAGGFGFPESFYRVNPDTGQANLINTTSSAFYPGLDFRQNGVLYGASSSLYTVNTNTGAATTIGALPELLTSIAFSPADRLFGVSNDGNTLYE